MRDPRRLLYLLPVALVLLAPRLVAIDGDTNGVSDVWAAIYGVTNLAPGDDPDGDGQDNLSESIAGTAPLDPLSRFASIATTDQTNLWVEWLGVTGKRYEVWYSYDLMEWELFDGPFTGAGTNLSVTDSLPSAGGGEMMMSPPDPLAESLAALDAEGISPTIQPPAGTSTAAGTKTTFSLHFVSALALDNGLSSLVFWDLRDDEVCLHHYRILSNIPLGRLPSPQQWYDYEAGWGVIFLDSPYRWKDAVWYYEIQDADALEKKLLESKEFTWVSEPFDGFAAYEPPSGWVLDYIQWLHKYFGDNIDRFAAEIVARDNELAGIEDPAAFGLAMSATGDEGGGMSTLSLEPDGIRKFYRVQTIPSIDFEGDGLDAYEEGLLGTSDTSADSDGDGVGDAPEFTLNLHPAVADDTDADGMFDDWEAYHFGSLDRSAAPTVTWMSPTNGEAIAVGTETYLAASVTDHDLVSNVVFFADGTNVGQDATYPFAVAWSNSVLGAHSLWAMATFGQGAATSSVPVSVTIFEPDPDGDGSPDAWELQYFGSTTNPDAVASADPDGDGFTNGFERLELTSPLDYFNGDLPEIEIVGGDMQGAPTNAFLAESLAVRLTRPSGLVYSNAPVTFSASAGGLAETNGGQAFLSLDVRADANGIARAWYRTPTAASTNSITATASNAIASTNVALTAFAGAGKPTLSVLAPDNVASEPGINRGLFHVVRTGNPWVDVTAQLGLSGTASNGLDYESLPTNLLLSAGLLTGAIELIVRDDTNSEAPETVVLRLLTNSAYDVASPASNTVTIADNDSGGGTAAIGAGDGFAAAIMYDGTIWTWGSDANGRLGNGDSLGSTNRPTQLEGQGLVGFRQISCGTAHVLALASNGTIKAWGQAGSGRLGNNNDSSDKQSPDDVDNLIGVIAVSAGDDHSMALTNGGKVFCWGDNEQGQVGVGTDTDKYLQPQLTTLISGVTRLSAGRRNSYAVQTGSLKGCGDNDRGQLARPTSGVGNIGETNRFITVLGGVEDMASGREFVLARVGDKVWTWGENQDWQLGAESPTYRTNAAQVAGISNVIAVAAGRNHSMALRSDRTVWSWGLGDNGRLGNGTSAKTATPVQATAAGFSNIIAIAAGSDHSMALDKQGWIWIWGANGNGQLGLGAGITATNRPTRIETLNLLSYPPTVQITAPADGLSLTNAAGRLALAATAEDPDGSVARLDFYEGTNLIGSDVSAPFTATWTNLPIGTWTFTAKATDNKGVTATSAPVTVTILSDDDTLLDSWEQGWFGNLNQDPGGDADNDGLTNEQEETLRTQPTYFDSDGDLLDDGYEVAHGMVPTSFDDPNADLEPDGLTNLQELIYGTDPNNPDSDGDGTSDGEEAASGGDPTNASDNGQPPPANELVTVNLEIGDDSGSHSERYEMTVAPTGGAPGPTIHHQWNQYGTLSPPTPYKFRKGFAYQVTIKWLGTREDYDDEPKPDYDYTARITASPGEPQQFIADDPQGIFGEHVESEVFFAAGKSATLIILRVASIDAASTAAGTSANPPPFEGHTTWPFDSAKTPPDKHLVVFYDDVIDAASNIQNFDITLTANLLPATITADKLDEIWSKISGPNSGSLNHTDTFQVKYQNPKQGGVYRFAFDLGLAGVPKSEANVVLPLSGAEISALVGADLARADAFAANANTKYPTKAEKLLRMPFWFWTSGNGDYLGRPNNSTSKTCVHYNQMNPSTGMGAACTWFGTSVLVAKLSNFMYAYTATKLGFTQAEIEAGGGFGTPDDDATLRCYYLGWIIANGAAYSEQVPPNVSYIWHNTNSDEHKIVWPNQEPHNLGTFLSPGFLGLSPGDI